MNGLHAYRFWAYAATFGALWGAVEVTIGSFLHAIKLPFSGVALAVVGASLLVALRTLHPVRGVVIAAGAVCAGVKLLSPAGAVIGPMTAILVESMLVELVVMPTGAHALSGGVAGALSGLWSVTQKLLTQTLFYGMPVLGIYKGILKQAEKTLHLPASGGAWAASAFLLVVALLGVVGGIAGSRIGSAARRQLTPETP